MNKKAWLFIAAIALCGIVFICVICLFAIFLNKPFPSTSIADYQNGTNYPIDKGILFVPEPDGWESSYTKLGNEPEMIEIKSQNMNTVIEVGIVYAKKSKTSDESMIQKTKIVAQDFLKKSGNQDLQISQVSSNENSGYCSNILTDHNLDNLSNLPSDQYRYAKLCTYVVPSANNEDVVILATVTLSREQSSKELVQQQGILNNMSYSLK